MDDYLLMAPIRDWFLLLGVSSGTSGLALEQTEHYNEKCMSEYHLYILLLVN